MAEVFIGGKAITLDPKKMLGQGGEATVYDIGSGVALKVYKQPNHPDFTGQPDIQRAVKDRLAQHQKKLQAFPQGMPAHVVAPKDIATSRDGKTVVGYTMSIVRGAEELLRYTDKVFRQGVDPNDILMIMRRLHQAVVGIHHAGAVIGDFNDLNVLVKDREPWMIDADSFQFGSFLCAMFTERFVDPILCTTKGGLMLAKPHTEVSDWYAYTVMLMQLLLYVGPYGGIHRPKNIADKMKFSERVNARVTVFHPDVMYPKPAIPYGVLPDELLHEFQEIFCKDKRSEFPAQLLDAVRWTTCTTCGKEHARQTCPQCFKAAPGSVLQKVEVRGKVIASKIFETQGVIVHAVCHHGMLRWLYHEKGAYLREDRTEVLKGKHESEFRFGIRGLQTMIAKQGNLAILHPTQKTEQMAIDTCRNTSVYSTNGDQLYWLQTGRLLRDGQFGPEHVGSVLAGQTLFWVGPAFGFGFYRAGEMSVAFVFSTSGHTLNDGVKIPHIRGQVIDASATFTDDRCYFFLSTQEQGKTINRCILIRANGLVEAIADGEQGDGSWLSSIRGKAAAGALLFSATDDGISRVEQVGHTLAVVKEFPDTEKFVQEGDHLFVVKEGLAVVSAHHITTLKFA